MRGTIQRIDNTPGRGSATLVIFDEFGDVSLVHVGGGPLLRAILQGKLRVGDVVEHVTIEIGTMPAAAVIAEGGSA